MKCDCPYCYFQSVGVAKEAVEFVDQTEAKKGALDFVYNAFREAQPQRRKDGRSENTFAIMLGEWGLGKTQLMKYLRTAINNSSGVTASLCDEYDLPFNEESPLARVTLESFIEDILREDPGFEPRAREILTELTMRRGVAFRVDALSFHDQIAGEPNLLVPLCNTMLKRCQIERRYTSTDDLNEATRLILERLEVDRVFLFFDELEALRTVETGPLQFDRFFQNFAIRIKSLLDNSSPGDVSICLSTIPSVWEALTRQFGELGALKSRAGSAFIELTPLTPEKAHQFILSRCRSADNSPFSDGTIRTCLEATGNNPRHLNQLCFGLQPKLKTTPVRQYPLVLDYLKHAATDQTVLTYDHQALLELMDGATESLRDSQVAKESLKVLAGELREYSTASLCQQLEQMNVPKVEEELNRLCTTRLRGVYPVVKLSRLDRSKALMSRRSLMEQKNYLVSQGYLEEKDVRIEKQRLLVFDLDYEREIIGPLETRYLDHSPTDCFLPVDDRGGREELMALWQLNEGPALQIYRSLAALAVDRAYAPLYRLSLAARERIFPRQSPKEPPFEWVDETFWRDTFALLHNPATASSEKRRLLLNGLRMAGQAYGAECTGVDETAFMWELREPQHKHAQYSDSKPLRSLVQLATEVADLETPDFVHRLHSTKPDFITCVSLTRLTDSPKVVATVEGRPHIEVIYRELGTREEFNLQLLSSLVQGAQDKVWYDPEKIEAAKESLANDVYGQIVGTWLENATQTGYLVTGWQMRHGVREDSLAAVLRELIKVIPSQPATWEAIMGLLRQLGLRDPLDEDLIQVLEQNGQIERDREGKLTIQVLPTQERVIELTGRVPRRIGELRDAYVQRVGDCFWQGPATELVRELERHVLVVEELGFFDEYVDLDQVFQRIDQRLDQVTHKDDDGATVDQYAYVARRGQIGAKRAPRLKLEREYLHQQYHLHETDFLRVEQDTNFLIPRVIRHQAIEVEKRAQEIIATGEGLFEEGKKAVQRARQRLESLHYELAGDGADICIKEHVAVLRDHASHPLLLQVIAAHREGVVDDTKSDAHSASSLLEDLEEELNELVEERDEVRREIGRYNDRHRDLMARADQLGKEPGLQQRVEGQANRLKRADPQVMFKHFKTELESAGLVQGKQKIEEAIGRLDDIGKELEVIGGLAQDLRQLGEVMDVMRRRQEELDELAKPSQVAVWGETYDLVLVADQARQLVQEVEKGCLTLEKLRSEYTATQVQKDLLDSHESYSEDLGKQVDELRKSNEDLLSLAETEIGSEEEPFSSAIGQAKEAGEWATHIASVVDRAFRAELRDHLVQLFQSLEREVFEERRVEVTEDLLKRGLEAIRSVIEIAEWQATDQVKIEHFASTDLDAQARRLVEKKTEIKSQAEGTGRAKKWATLYRNLSRLFLVDTESYESSGSIPEFNAEVREFMEQATRTATEHINHAENFIQALLSAKLLSITQRQQWLKNLRDLGQAELPYQAVVSAVNQLNQQVSEDAKRQLAAKQLPGGHDPDVVLALVQAVHQEQSLSLKQALSFDQESRGQTILWLVAQGVLEGRLNLVRE